MDCTIYVAIFCDCTARIMSDLVGNPEDRFSHNEAQLLTEKIAYFSIQDMGCNVG